MKKREYLAIHSEGHELKTALVQGDRDQYEILELHSDVKPLDITTSATLVSGIPAWNIFLREFSFNLNSKREILSVLPFQVESQLPYPLSDLVLYPILHKKKDAQTDVTLFALNKSVLAEHLHFFQSNKMDPSVVSTTCNALQRFAESHVPKHPSLIIYHLGIEKSSAIVISDGKILLSQTQNFGTSTHSLDLFEKDLERFSTYIKKKSPHVTDLLIVGEGSDLHTSLLIKIFSAHFSLINFSDSKLKKYAIPIGLCLDAMKQDSRSVQFRVGDYLPIKKSQQRSKWIKSYLAGSLLLLILTTLGGNFFLNKKEKALFSLLNLHYANEKHLTIEQAVLDYASISSSNKAPFPFALTVPKVSDILVWASNHPKLKESNGEIKINHLHYQLIKYPKLESPSLPYAAQVEMKFTSRSPRLAREFYDALLKGDAIVNGKQQIIWKADNDNYHVTFHVNSVKGKKL